MTVAELIVKIGADATQFVRQMEVTKRQVATVSRAMESFGRTATYAVTLPMVGLAGAMIKASANMEQTRIAMTTMTGSAEKAGAMLKQVQQLAIETPFGLQELTTATRQLLAYNFAGDKAVDMLRTVGDASAALGQGSFGMERIIRALGQMQAKSRVMAQEMNQLAEVGINGWNMISDATGMAVKDVQKATEQGMVSAAVGIQAILDGMNRRFGGAMAAQNKTLAGQWERLVDTAKATMRDFGDAVLPIAKGIVQSLGNSLKELSDRFAAMDIHEKNATMAMYVMIAAIPPLVMMIGKIIGVIGALKLAGAGVFAPGSVIMVGVAALAVLIYKLTKRWLDHNVALREAKDRTEALAASSRNMTNAQIETQIAALKSLNVIERQNASRAWSDYAAAGYDNTSAGRGHRARWEQWSGSAVSTNAQITRYENILRTRGLAGAGGGSAVGGLAPGLGGGGTDSEMTAAQQREAALTMARLREKAYTEWALSQVAGLRTGGAPGIWGAGFEQEEIKLTAEKMDETGLAAERFQTQFDGYVGSFTNWTNGFMEIGDRMGNVAASIAMNWQSAGKIITNALQQMTAQLIGAIAKAIVFKALMTMFGIPMGDKDGGTFGGIIKGALGFADGGIITKPTLAMIGERNEPEAVIPLSKMGQFGGTQTINIVLDGQVLASAVSNRQAKEVRMRGVLAA